MRLHHRWTEIHTKLGPRPGLPRVHQFTNHAKHNQAGRVEYLAVAPHLNPLRDSSSWFGLIWIHRLVVLGEATPDFLNLKAYFIFFAFYAVTKSPKHRFPKKTHSNLYTKFHRDAKVSFIPAWLKLPDRSTTKSSSTCRDARTGCSCWGEPCCPSTEGMVTCSYARTGCKLYSSAPHCVAAKIHTWSHG